MTRPRILVLGTLDTKGEEFEFLRDQLRELGCDPIIVDLGIMGTPRFEADVTREDVLAKTRYTLDDLRHGDKRGEAIEAVIAGGTAVAVELYNKGEVDGVIALGGGSGTTIGTTIMQALPLGVPKVIVTTLSKLHPWVKGTDVVVIRTLVDLVGLNSITRLHIAQAAAAISGMARQVPSAAVARRSIVITCLGVTTPGVMHLRELLLAGGKDVLVLHRRTHNLPLLVSGGYVEAIVDFTPNEITDAMVHPKIADPDDRLRDARESGIPIVLSAGALDMHIHFGSKETIPSVLGSRETVVHSRDALLLQTTADEQGAMGAVLGRQMTSSMGPVAAVIPMGGFSMWDADDRAFYSPESREAFASALERTAPAGTVTRLKAHINSAEYARELCARVLELLD